MPITSRSKLAFATSDWTTADQTGPAFLPIAAEGVDVQVVTITSDEGGDTGAVTVSENGAAVTTVTATSPDGSPLTFSITGGADATRFTIDAATGALAFLTVPDFEAPGDAAGVNVYDVVVSASDGSTTDSQTLAVTVDNVDEGPTITSDDRGDTATVYLYEGTSSVSRLTANDPEGDPITYAITGGADAARFTISPSTSGLSFVFSPDFETPADADGDNFYDVVVSATSAGGSDSQAFTIRVLNKNEAPVFTSANPTSVVANENVRSVASFSATDVDNGVIRYAIHGGADAARFSINPTTGELVFRNAPNFETPEDVGADNVYNVQIRAYDFELSAVHSVAVRVANVDEALYITSHGGADSAALSVDENSLIATRVTAFDPDRGAIVYTIVGGADAARFVVNGRSGALDFASAPNFEAQTDVGGNNVYDVVVEASDGTFVDRQAIAVTVRDVEEFFTVNGTSYNDVISPTAYQTALRSTAGNDLIYGNGGSDTIYGGDGNDVIDGGSGNDSIRGQAGADRMTGGIGMDTFVFDSVTDSAVGVPDVITDFSRASGDKISVNPIDASTYSAGNQNFWFIGAQAFTNVPGQLRFEQVGGNTFVMGDVDGDGATDFQIQVAGLIDLAASDFIL